MKTCACGCGTEVENAKKFVRGHHVRIHSAMSEARRGKTSWNKGIPRTDEEKKLMSERRKGKNLGKRSPELGRKVSTALKGRKKSPEHLKKIMNARKSGENYETWRKSISSTLKKKYKDGELKSCWWIDGRSKNDPKGYYQQYGGMFTKELKQIIRKRDKFVCQECSKPRSCCVHHIDENKQNNERTKSHNSVSNMPYSLPSHSCRSSNRIDKEVQ